MKRHPFYSNPHRHGPHRAGRTAGTAFGDFCRCVLSIDLLFSTDISRDILSFGAFCDLCEKYQSCPELRLCCFHNSSPDVLTLLLRNMCDLCVCIQTPESSLRTRCSALHLEYVPLMRFPLCVQLSCSHPLLKEKEFILSKLSDYPCTVFSSPDSLALNTEAFPFVNPSRLIRVESSTSRRDTVARTNAFSVVPPHSKEYSQKHGLVNIPLPQRRM